MLPLEGVRILALSQFGAGPYGTLHLADLGAEIIKIEDPATGGDVARYVPPGSADGDSFYFQSLNRNTRSITLNLRNAEGRRVFHDLVRVSDGVFSNLRGDQPRVLGLTFDQLQALNPRIVCCSLSGFGMTGPLRDEPGYDYVVQAYAGLMSLTGEPDAPPARSGVSVIDFAGGVTAMLGLMVGLLAAQRSGKGCDVDVSLLDTAIGMLNYLAAWTLNAGYQPARLPYSSHPTLYPSQVFDTSDGYLVVMCAKEKFWRALVDAIDAPDLGADPRFRTFADRYRHREALIDTLRCRFKQRTTAAWLARLRGKVPCAPVNTVQQALEHEQVLAREMVIEVEHPTLGPIRETNTPIRIGGAAPRRDPAPALGADTDAILREVLAYTDEQVGSVRAAGAVS